MLIPSPPATTHIAHPYDDEPGFVVAAFWTGVIHGETFAIRMSSDLFYLLLLPPIIFEGGFTLSKVAFFKNLPLIILLAFVGAFYSTMVTSILMYFFSKLVSPWSFVESLVFGRRGVSVDGRWGSSVGVAMCSF